jgi:hypothetical protein
MKLLRFLKAHLSYHREVYFVAPFSLVLLALAIRYVAYLTGRDVTEDIGALVATMVNLARVALLALFLGAIQKHFYGYRSERQDAAFRDDVFDAFVTTFLLLALGYVVFCK